jgi:hypothetical protein
VDTAPGDGPPERDDGPSDPSGSGLPATGSEVTDPEATGGEATGPEATGGEATGGEAAGGEHEPPGGSDPLRFNRWMKHSATGAVLTGISLGFRQALETNRNEPAIMIEASGQPEDPDNPIQLHFDPDSPEDTVAFIRHPVDRTDPEAPPAGG